MWMFAIVLMAQAGSSEIKPLPSRDTVCPTDPSRLGDVGFDARDGAPFGSMSQGATDHLRVVIYEKNPFAYSYRVRITAMPTDTTNVAQLLAALKLPGASDLTKLRSQPGSPCDLESTSTTLKTKLDEMHAVALDAKSSCSSIYKAVDSVVKAANPFLVAWDSAACLGWLSTYSGTHDQVVTALKQIDAIYAAPDNFFEIRNVPINADEATTVTVELFRTPGSGTATTEEQVFHRDIQVGAPRTSLTVGPAFLSLPSRTVIRQPTKQADGSSKNAFGYSENSKRHFGFAILLNGDVVTLPRFSVFPASTIALSAGGVIPGDGPAIDFLGGVSWIFAKTISLTAGAELTRVTHIAGGYSQGDLIPDNLADPLPTEKNWQVGSFISLSYRLK